MATKPEVIEFMNQPSPIKALKPSKEVETTTGEVLTLDDCADTDKSIDDETPLNRVLPSPVARKTRSKCKGTL